MDGWAKSMEAKDGWKEGLIDWIDGEQDVWTEWMAENLDGWIDGWMAEKMMDE